jgi:hypothetical protein
VKQAKIELHRRISESFRVSQTALRMRVMRIKQKLTVCVRECMCGEGAVTLRAAPTHTDGGNDYGRVIQ